MVKRLRIPRLEPSGTRAKLRAWDRPREGRPYSADDSRRMEREPWRRRGYGAEYRRNRQAALDRTGGRCASCGRQIASRDAGGRWRMDGGEVHHAVPLRDGGAASAANLVPLCIKCHKQADTALRRRENG